MRFFVAVFLLAGGMARAKPSVCDGPGQCQVVPRSCCGTCGSATEDDAIAVNVEAEERSECAGSKCPRCTEAPNADRAHQLVAVCEKKTCRLLKLDRLPLTACRADADCVPVPVDCCGGLSVAVRKDAADALKRRMCGRTVMCPAVASPAPAVACVARRCAVL